MNNNKPVIAVFYCVNALGKVACLTLERSDSEVKSIKLPCSSMVKDVFLLRAFEAGADAVVVLTCPEGECQYIDGNIRARKRVERLKDLLNEIGLGRNRLSLFNISLEDKAVIGQIIQDTVSKLVALEPGQSVHTAGV